MLTRGVPAVLRRTVPEDEPAWDAYRRALGDRLREARLAAGLTQERLAQDAGVSRTLVQRTERAYGEVAGVRAMWRLARACGAPVHDLLHEDDDPATG